MPITEEMYALFATDFGHRVKTRREECKITQSDLADKIRVSKTTIQNYEAGNIPKGLYLFKLSRALKCSIDYLMIGEESPYIQEDWVIENPSGMNDEELTEYNATKKNWLNSKSHDNGLLEQKPISPEDEVEGREYVRVPRYEVAASAGGGAFVESEQIVDYLSFRSEWVRNALGVSPKALALINVIGDSMEPTLSDGDVVLLDTTLRGVQDSAIYVMQLNGTLLVKRIQNRLDGSLEVMSDNSRYKPETVSGEAINQLKIIGRVVWAGRKM